MPSDRLAIAAIPMVAEHPQTSIATPGTGIRPRREASGRSIPPGLDQRRPSTKLAGAAFAVVGLTAVLVIGFGHRFVAGGSDRPAAAVAASLEPQSPRYAAALLPGPITFGTKLKGVTVSDPTSQIAIGTRVIWVARLSQPTIEPDVEISVAAVVAGDQVVLHRESTTIGLNGILTANPGLNSRDLGVGSFIVRYTSLGTVLAQGTFAVVK